MTTYGLSVGAIFKNESHSIQEWIRHYLHHGVEHFYLINDASTDNSVQLLEPYIASNIVTVFESQEPYYLGRQRTLYNKYILPRVKETKWLLMVDLDEYVWSKIHINLYSVLQTFETYAQIQMYEVPFGSNGLQLQPKYLVPSFTKRRETNTHKTGRLKYFIQTSYEFSSLNIHHADFVEKTYVTDHSKFIIANSNFFTMNHYNCQTKEFWNTVKCTRGDADNFLTRTPAHFAEYDLNEVEDLDLYEQNKELYTSEIKSQDPIGNELGTDPSQS